MLSLVKMGFPRKEAEVALASSSSGEVMGHDTLLKLLEPLRSVPAGYSGDRSKERSSNGSAFPSSARDEEVREVLAHGESEKS